MFFRIKRSGSGRITQLVRSERGADGKIRQQLVVSLGSHEIPDALGKEVARQVENRLNGYRPLLALDLEVAGHVDFVLEKLRSKRIPIPPAMSAKPVGSEELVEVFPDRTEHQNSTSLGVLLLLEAAWKSLELSEFLGENGFSQRQINSAKVNIYNRLVDPGSENALLDWAATTSLNELLGENLESSGRDRFYRVADRLLEHQAGLEKHLRTREEDIFSLSGAVILCDLTNSYFEGECEANPKARRSMNSKEMRTDCPLLALGLVVDGEGFPICHQVFPGNMHDCKSLVEFVKLLSEHAGLPEHPTVVLDGGIATAENLDTLTANGYHYIVNGKRASRKNFYEDFVHADDFAKIGGRPGKAPVFVRRICNGKETILLCRSEARKLKEDAMVSRKEEKLLEELEKLRKRIAKNDGKLRLDKGGDTVNRAIGRIAGKYAIASKFYRVEYDAKERVLSATRLEQLYEADAQLHGCYHLRTDRGDLTDDELWHVYISLVRLEAGFRKLKSVLGLRPFFHQLEKRCDGHVFVSVLAYHLMCWVERKLLDGGYDGSYSTVCRLLETHRYATIILTLRDGSRYEVRKPGMPDERQRSVYQIFGVDLCSLPVFKNRRPTEMM